MFLYIEIKKIINSNRLIMYDLGIIGAGPAGYVAAERAGQKGLNVVLFDKKFLGGVCLNEGCIPTKTMLYSAKLLDSAREAEKYGIIIPSAAYDYAKILQRKNKVIQKLVGGIGAAMKRFKVEVVMAHAEILERGKDHVKVRANDKTFECKNLLICTGSEAFVPPIKGLVREEILTNREILEMTEVPKTLTIIGGGVIGMEFGSFFNSMGSKVTIIEMQDEILPGIDKEMSGMLRKDYEKKGIQFNLGAKVVEIKGKDVFFEKAGQTQSIHGDKLLVSVGRRPVTQGFGLEKLGVELDRGGIKIDNKCRTNVPNVFAAGDVKGFALLAHTASREGEVVVNNLTGRNDIMRYDANPGVVYTNPEIASVGLTEDEAIKRGVKYNVKSLQMGYAGRFTAENEGKTGLCKVLVGQKYGEVLGVHMIGNPSSEMIYGACMAIEAELRIQDIEEIIFPHPTVSEIFKENMFAFHGDH